MERPLSAPLDLPLRDPYPTEQIDARRFAPNPEEMGEMYIGAREKYTDGMTLATASPRQPYEEVKRIYRIESQAPDFSDVAFFDQYFEVEPPTHESYQARPGQSIDDYTLEMRERFIFPNTDQGHFDVKLPYNRAVAGIGRFGRHSFLWDGYHMAKGYAVDDRWDLVRDMVDNIEYQINRFGHALNGSADFYTTRAQPDYFAHMVRMLADRIGPEALTRYLPTLEKNYKGYWMDGKDVMDDMPIDGNTYTHRALVRMPDGSYLNRYWDDGEGPRLESYSEDVETALNAVGGASGQERMDRLQKVYKDLRAGAASGWDFSSRYFEDGKNIHTINTTDILPVDHNSLMAYHEQTLAMAYRAAGDLDRSEHYSILAQDRERAINKYLWDPTTGMYRDYNFRLGKQTDIVSAATVYPLYTGIANGEQSVGVMEALHDHLMYPGGIIATNTENSNEQWDGGVRGGERSKNVWAPFNWAAVRGLARTVHMNSTREREDRLKPAEIRQLFRTAFRIQRGYTHGIQAYFSIHGTIPEKHRGDFPTKPANGGEYELVTALGMSIETYRAMKHLRIDDASDHLPMGKLAARAVLLG